MSKHARIRRERAEREAAAQEEKERGPITEGEARRRSAIMKRSGMGTGTWASGARYRRQVKRIADFRVKAAKKRREKKRGRR